MSADPCLWEARPRKVAESGMQELHVSMFGVEIKVQCFHCITEQFSLLRDLCFTISSFLPVVILEKLFS